MSQAPQPQTLTSPKNRLLAALPTEDYQRLLPHLKVVSLTLKQIIHTPGRSIEHVYFPQRSLISLVTIMKDGTTVENNLVGKEGMVGIQAFLGHDTMPHQAIVQVADGAMQMPVNVLKAEFDRGGALHNLLLHYLRFLYIEATQGIACNGTHTIEERLSRWLLNVSDCLRSNELPLTQETIAQMLGIRRAGVTVAAGALQQAGSICYRRGHITILDQEALKAATCECYQVIKTARDRLLHNEYGQTLQSA